MLDAETLAMFREEAMAVMTATATRLVKQTLPTPSGNQQTWGVETPPVTFPCRVMEGKLSGSGKVSATIAFPWDAPVSNAMRVRVGGTDYEIEDTNKHQTDRTSLHCNAIATD